jgi:hypothetical protein
LAQTSSDGFLQNLSKLGINLDELVQKESPEDMAQTQIDPSQMNSDEMKQYSESVAQAADVVDLENNSGAAAQKPSKEMSTSEKAALIE